MAVGLCGAGHDGLSHSARSRFEDAAAVLGADYGGVIVRDGWAPYREFTQAIPQSCLAHLLRRSELLLTD